MQVNYNLWHTEQAYEFSNVYNFKIMNTLQAVDLANYIFKQGYKSNIQINKLLYIAFGFYGAKTGKYLFNDVIETWRYGPLYRLFIMLLIIMN